MKWSAVLFTSFEDATSIVAMRWRSNATPLRFVAHYKRNAKSFPKDAYTNIRELTVQITQIGVDVFERIPKDREKFWRSTIGKLSVDEQKTLLELLKKLEKVMEKPSEIEHRFTM